ncbi:hypothetical protein P7D22_16355 [Lichenihabitans sp. Uapishka_5]|uniref:hypothetical protein n=1 Tax=Lichenihabitans sp. Uapishka_5 TaxID=3037302 RepID=UPI0029E7CDCB|nr:hypothetical protein [Lichenihabitans sp. Uapishka_5]MDX7952741.1 hypothetical protein [Lichenihabitans sp. Uapishka_5]
MRLTFRCDPALIDRLEPPMPARAALPAWLRSMPAAAFSPVHDTEVRTVKHCPPFVDAMSHGVVIPLPCDVTVSDGRLSWDWDLPPLSVEAHPRSPLSFHVPAQVSGTPFHHPDRAVVKFNSFWTIALEPGWSLFATHPVNREDLPFRTLTGLVDADRFTDVGILFPAVWVDPGFEGVLPRGTPVCQCFPVPRQPLDIVVAPLEAEHQARYAATAAALLGAPGHYRKHHRVGRSRSAGEVAPESFEIEP